jgi:hypothetical protein
VSPSPFQAREVVRSQPYGTQKTYIQQVVANNGILLITFDIAQVITDRNQLFPPVTVSSSGIPSVGPYLDVMVVSTGIGTLDAAAFVDSGAPFASSLLAAPIAVPVIPLIATITGLRIPARYCSVQFQNTSGGDVTVDFGAFMRSN